MLCGFKLTFVRVQKLVLIFKLQWFISCVVSKIFIFSYPFLSKVIDFAQMVDPFFFMPELSVMVYIKKCSQLGNAL